MALHNILERLRAPKSAMTRVGPIGMDIGMSSINLCQLKKLSEQHFSVLASVSIDFSGSRSELLSSPKQLKKLLTQGMSKKGFYNRNVVTVLPPDKLKIIPITYKANAADAGQEIIKLLTGRLEGNIADYIIDYFPVRANAQDEEHLALATIARQDDVMQYLQALNQANFTVEALDVGPAALRRLVSCLYTDEPAQTILVVNAGINNTYLTVISGRRLLFDQSVVFGEQMLLEQLSRALDLPPDACRELVFRHGMKAASPRAMTGSMTADADFSQAIQEILKPAFVKLLEEINRVLIFTTSETHGLPVSQVCLLGSMARWPGADELLHELINVPLSCIKNSFNKIIEDPSGADSSWSDNVPELAVATGLALRGLVDND